MQYLEGPTSVSKGLAGAKNPWGAPHVSRLSRHGAFDPMTDMLDPNEPTFRKPRNVGHPQSPRCQRKITPLFILSFVETWATRQSV